VENTSNRELPWFIAGPDPNVYLGDDWLIVDFETTNKDKGSALNAANDIVLATWATPRGVFHKWGGIFDQGDLVAAVKAASFVVCQNAKFELQWFIRLGIDISKVLVYDTMLADYVIAGNRRWRLDLDSIARRYGVATKSHYIKRLLGSGVCPSDMPRSALLSYGLGDTINERDVFLRQRNELKRLGLLGVLYTRCLTCVVLADIETRGVYLDEQRVASEYGNVSTELAELEQQLNQLTGGVNANSPKQLGAFLYDRLGFEEITGRDGEPERTPAGGRKVDADTISRLRPNTGEQREFQEKILKRQDLNKKHQTLEKLKAACDENENLLFARFNQAVTQTHRLSSGGARYKVQFQNIPRDYKSLFCARRRNDGWLVGEADGAQLEFRVAAHLGRDRVAAKDIRDKVDVHSRTASAYLGIPPDKVSKDQRQNHKSKTFEPLYGKMGGDKATKAYLDYFHDRYSDTFNTQTGWTYQVLEKKELVTEWGMRFYWPDTELQQRKYGKPYITNTTSIFNYPVQSFATAEIIPIGLVFIWHRMKQARLHSFLVNTVHDSIIAELHHSETETFKSISLQSLTHDTYKYLKQVYNVDFTVPLGAEVKISPHWGDDDEIKAGLGTKEAWDVEPPQV
jgi:DNA polymerase I-like protein with 3'-5' exonuclease and polymerase domains